MARNQEKRTRNWATIIYPRTEEGQETTCPDNWAEILSELAVKCAVSPLHDKDVLPTGEMKKAHRHVVIAFDGVKTERQAREVFDKIGGVGAEPVQSLWAYTRYLTHLDNPEKAQYSSLDVLTFGGYEYKRYAVTKDDEEKEIVENMGTIFNICAQNAMYDFADTAEYLMMEEPKLFTTFRKNPYFFATFFKSKQQQLERLHEQARMFKKFNLTDENGEVIFGGTEGSLHNPHKGQDETSEEQKEQGGKE